MLLELYGIVEYNIGNRAVVLIDDNLGCYYRSLIPKYLNVKPPRYSTHITIVRKGVEKPNNMNFWENIKILKLR